MLALLLRLQRERGMALVLITHDLGVVAEVAQRVARDVRRADRRERGRRRPVRAAAPSLHRGAARVAARAQRRPAPARARWPASSRARSTDRPAACSSPRCPYVRARCRRERPALFEVGASRARCFFPLPSAGRAGRAMSATPPGARDRALPSTTRSRRGLFGAARDGARARRRLARARAGTHARRRRRIGLRQEHARAPDRDARDADRGRAAHRRRRCRPAPTRRRGARCGAACRWCSRTRSRASTREEDRPGARGAARDQHRPEPAAEREARPRRCWPASASRPSTTGAIRTCSRAGSASASRSRAR